MNRYKYDEHGFITSWGSFPEQEPNTIPDLEGAGLPSDIKLRVVNGIITRTDKSVRPPSEWHSWSNGDWLDLKPLSVLKSEKKSLLDDHKSMLEIAPIATDLGVFDADSISLQRMQLFVNSGISSTAWTLENNTFVVVSATQIAEVIRLIAYRAVEVHHICRQLKQRVEEASTAELVHSITWPMPPQ